MSEADPQHVTQGNDPSRKRRLSGAIANLLRRSREIPGVDSFAVVTLLPVPLLLVAGVFGGVAAWAALAVMVMPIVTAASLEVRDIEVILLVAPGLAEGIYTCVRWRQTASCLA